MELLVSYVDQKDSSQRIRERLIRVDRGLDGEAFLASIKGKIRPLRLSDPSDGYRGSSPGDIVLVSVTDLSSITGVE